MLRVMDGGLGADHQRSPPGYRLQIQLYLSRKWPEPSSRPKAVEAARVARVISPGPFWFLSARADIFPGSISATIFWGRLRRCLGDSRDPLSSLCLDAFYVYTLDHWVRLSAPLFCL